ncbi:hypothetical protein [Costertonia aggregata]|uniref:DinB family protein n=1 Tax=Costertonia aggregata TaxID=343403 RepID=A0A7H9ASN4_9FLAO|nr:hypothetical protein [Costertonia aggregata]QLG46417.1 hypothetical protein HYG79_14025 [Costertonia aggregata]
MKKLSFLFILITTFYTKAQEQDNMKLPFAEIPKAQEEYNTGNVIARFIEGLGYRYYWATEGLTEKDLDFKVSADSRSTKKTLIHIFGLSESILNVSKNKPNIRPYEIAELSFNDLREKTLVNLQEAAHLFYGKHNDEINELMVVFERERKQTSFPFWNFINGQLSDAIYHVGQVVANRRASGNPINPKVNVFTGKTDG